MQNVRVEPSWWLRSVTDCVAKRIIPRRSDQLWRAAEEWGQSYCQDAAPRVSRGVAKLLLGLITWRLGRLRRPRWVGETGASSTSRRLRQVSRELLPSTSLQAGCRNSFVEPGQIERLLDDDCTRDPSLHIRCVAGDEHDGNVAAAQIFSTALMPSPGRSRTSAVIFPELARVPEDQMPRLLEAAMAELFQ